MVLSPRRPSERTRKSVQFATHSQRSYPSANRPAQHVLDAAVRDATRRLRIQCAFSMHIVVWTHALAFLQVPIASGRSP